MRRGYLRLWAEQSILATRPQTRAVEPYSVQLNARSTGKFLAGGCE
jgi:hypothetical protein